ncbi:sugar transferase [Flavisolibacter ginsengisoli]|jgi:lipopolysaccharide/colanic/teichoic acid biosynthesis glycosyltransferase|uniref:Sugar transferase involved in LPS biosynthesis (Colanic, teichoic acid) n=1 Tax=Flavisolibacter ginsengisoli DSM 18119 TaxID=1121884 RepID=A0A1M5GG85_9BACT|nr:sugar transferase [Flavisolibacter ginsengisoli]SHG02719.1 Sugar transferase involved in LPS biosynthesis (colanic, teichoic acid) [Flavisolibacter ginsengisoli DSM 18119]
MQADLLNKATQDETRKYLRVATITNEKSPLFFLYVGKNDNSIKFLLNTTISGVIAENMENAKKLIKSENFNEQTVDVIILDVPYNPGELKSFESFIRSMGKGYSSIPVIYNECQLPKDQLEFYTSIVDDVIDLSNWQFNFSSKISFLKKAKEYNMALHQKEESVKPEYSISKRLLDIILSTLLLIVALPILALIALAIRLESKGPIFYAAKRAGRGFKIFKFYKFRTMVVNADKKIEALAHLNQYGQTSNGAKFFKIANDPRITKVGKFLRNSSLDELPQLFNVLKGDMSLVGNRPLPLYEAATLTTNDFVERFMAPAGITGLWQIKKRGKAEMSIDERISLDISYARQANILYDFWIMAKTPAALLQKSDV